MHHFNLLLVKLVRLVNDIRDKCSSFTEDVIHKPAWSKLADKRTAVGRVKDDCLFGIYISVA